MTATAYVLEGNEASVSWSTITAGRFCTDDESNPGTNNPIPIPTTDTTVYSYFKSHALEFTGSFSTISDVKIYTDGTGFGTGIAVAVSSEVLGDGSYQQATGTVGTGGDEMVTTHAGVSATQDFFDFVSGSPKDVHAAEITAVGHTSHVILQLFVTSAASQGELSDETITWQYNEI